MEKMNEIKLPECVDRIAVKQYDDKIVFEFIPKEAKFKVGDEVMIKKGISSETHRDIFPCFTRDLDDYIGQKLVINNVQWHTNGVYLYRVDENMYRFLEDWLEPYTEELKKGDLAIFWNEETLPDGDAIIARYNCADIIDLVISHHSADGGVYNFAVKWDGTKEQFEKILRGEI